MTAPATAYNRSRPLLGTFFTISVRGAARPRRAVDAAFAEAARLEAMLTLFHPGSALSALNDAPAGAAVRAAPELRAVLSLALRVRRASGGAFNPFFPRRVPLGEEPLALARRGLVRKRADARLDLSGIAKGFIVDRAAALLRRRLPRASGVVNAGGDLRFFGRAPRRALLRLGDARRPVLRPLAARLGALATSSATVSRRCRRSATRHGRLAPGLTSAHAVAVVARRCAVADALTKVGLHAGPAAARACAARFGARLLRFSPDGRAAA